MFLPSDGIVGIPIQVEVRTTDGNDRHRMTIEIVAIGISRLNGGKETEMKTSIIPSWLVTSDFNRGTLINVSMAQAKAFLGLGYPNNNHNTS